jgi:hypothetical protein
MKKKIWTPYKIWDETQWFNDINKIINKYLNKKNKNL